MNSFDIRNLMNAEMDTISLAGLRTNDVLRKDEWKAFDEAIVNPARIPLRAVDDLLTAGMVQNLGEEGYMSSTLLEWETGSEVDPATNTMDGIGETKHDRPEFTLYGTPLPLQIKEFGFSMRNLAQSRKLGQPLDTTTAELSTRQIAELIENNVVNGDSSLKFKGYQLYGYTTAPNRIANTTQLNANGGSWEETGKTGEQMLADVIAFKAALEAQKFYGPYMVYLPRDCSVALDADFKSATSGTIRERLLKVDGIQGIKILDKLATNNMLMVQMDTSVCKIIRGFDPRVLRWEKRGGLAVDWAIMSGMSFRINTDSATGKSGILHATSST